MTEENDNLKQMRDHIKQLEKQNKQLQEQLDGQSDQLRQTVFEAAGIDPNKGIGKAIANTFDGEELTAEALLAHAKSEFEWEPAKSSGSPAIDEDTQAHMKVDEIVEVDLTAQAKPTSDEGKIAQSLEAGDLKQVANDLGLQMAKSVGLA